MNRYFFTLFVRFFVAFSGLIVFVVSSKLYGAEGRGVIGLGTSIVSLIGLMFSFNLGRIFFFETRLNQNLKKKLLPGFLSIQFLLMIAAIFISGMFWYLSSNIREIIDSKSMIAFLILIPFYLWSVNGNTIYAVLNKTTQQDYIILLVRIFLLAVTFLFLKLNIQDVKVFIFFYALILSVGALAEIRVVGISLKGISHFYKIGKYIMESKYFHLDFLAFNTYPLLLMILASSFLNLSELGKLNFLIQSINFVFLLSVVASIKVKSYISNSGSVNSLRSISKLFLFTVVASVILIAIMFVFLKTNFFSKNFSSFSDLSAYYLMISLALPGYIVYQFVYPIIIESDQIHFSCKFNLLILAFTISLSYPVIERYRFVGCVSLFVLFYLLILISQIYIFFKRPRSIAT